MSSMDETEKDKVLKNMRITVLTSHLILLCIVFILFYYNKLEIMKVLLSLVTFVLFFVLLFMLVKSKDLFTGREKKNLFVFIFAHFLYAIFPMFMDIPKTSIGVFVVLSILSNSILFTM